MKNRLFIIIMLGIGWTVHAAQLVRVESLGPMYEVPEPVGADHVYVFNDVSDASFHTINGEAATWIELANNDRTTGFNTFQDVQDGYCYRVEQGDQKETFVVLAYQSHRVFVDTPSITMMCQGTEIDFHRPIHMTYYTDSLNVNTGQYDIQSKLSQRIEVTYTNQQWMESRWETVPVVDTLTASGTGVARIDEPILCDTRFVLREFEYSPYFSADHSADSITIDTVTAIAVAHHQVHYIARRGRTSENEMEGPYDDQTIVRSAPLDVLFESHPSEKADIYSWKIARGQDTITVRNDKDIRYVFDDASESGSVTYTVNLIVKNSDYPECEATAQDTITLNSSFIIVPNVFTPNGDQANDEFRVAYRSICDFHCWVYNRWQHLVYSWDDPTKGWDGTYNGKPEPASAYVYIIEATGCDGHKYKLKGMVNLLRDYKE